ncbi:hypothetical protein AAE478_009840 [Parahypoxylon ruwenzoriense]
MVLQAGTLPRSLESLPARPPTPPREKNQDADSSAQHILANHPVDIRLNLHTPPNHSPGSTETADTSSRRERKKVGFSTQAEYRDAPTYADKENVRKQRTPISAPSSIASVKPLKPILKHTSSPEHRNPLDLSAVGDEATGQINITTMLDSTIKQLAGADRESRIDAYMMLARALKTSNNLPDRIALQDKMSLFMQFIQRDVTTKGPNGNLDTSMVNHALTLLCTFFHFPAIASTLSSDFGVFIIDHCIRSFEDPSAPKDVVRHLMQVAASQDFSLKVMTADRVGRLVASLHRIEGHLKGKSIIMSRILIYRRLVKQARSHMITHSDWLLDLFTDMLSTMKEIRAAAIALGLEASLNIGKEKQLSRRVMEILQLTVEETKYIEYYVERLMTMTKDKNESSSVPQVWSVVILLLRCPVDRWEFFGPWLEIIQRCFNSGDYHTKLEANYAWNRFVYVLQLNEASLSKTIGTVCQPFISQLRRKGSGKQLDELRRVVMASLCNLYYYAFKPNSSLAHVDSYWDACVRPLLQRLVSPETDGKSVEKPTAAISENISQASLILTGLFNSSTPRLWKEDRIAENPLVKPDELPGLDPKWVRRNAVRVFSIVEPILQKTFSDLANSDSVSFKLWRTLVGAVAVAASKEVKVSTDTATFMAHALSVLVKIWSRGLNESNVQPGSQRRFLDATREYLVVMVDSLGLLPFTEKLLSLNKQNSFVPVATPSHRSGKGQGLTRTPLHHLFSILSTSPPGIPDNDGLLSFVKAVFDPFIAPRSSHARMDLARELVQALPMDALYPYGPWVFISEILSSSLENSQVSQLTSTSGSEPTTVGHEYREIVKHLERGVKSTPNLPWEQWHSLFQLLVTRVNYEAGEAGCAIAVVEPLAKTFTEYFSLAQDQAASYNLFKSSIKLVAIAKQPRDRQALDAARRRLWGTSIAGSRSTSFDPFDNFYRLTTHLLEISYTQADHYDQDEIVVPLLTEVANFLTRCNRLLVFKSLVQLQHGIGLWIQDVDARYSSKQSSKVSDAVKVLWDRICSLFLDAELAENLQLDTVEDLLCSSFQSKHRHIVNTVAAMWNRAFEQIDEIQYPEKLKAVLVSLHPYVDIVLPGLDMSSYESTGQVPSFIESQDDMDVPNLPFESEDLRKTPPASRPSSSRRSATPGSIHLSLPTKRRLDATPVTSRPTSARHSVTPRLRHNDSQIQFAPIESSSPSLGAMESQLLTDRQKEVRERQRENATLYSHIRASAEKRRSPRLLHSDQTKHSQGARATTPQPNLDFEDFVSSTPTPRRGQAPVIDDDHEMTDDIPSSPPEPRRNLLAEMQPRTRSSSVFQEFPLSSSPISGSPTPNRQAPSTNQAQVVERDAADTSQGSALEVMHHSDPNDATNSQPEHAFSGVEHTTDQIKTPTGPATPPNSRTSGKAADSSPTSDPEVFVDALTSPIPQAPRALRSNIKSKNRRAVQTDVPAPRSKDVSFELSDDEEQSMARLAIELDSKECEPMAGCDSKSPETREADIHALECIMVNTGSKRSHSKSKKIESRQLSPVVPSSSAEVESSQSASKKSKRKRKRGQDSGSSKKKRKHRKNSDAEEVEAASDNQYSQGTTEDAAEIDTEMEDVELGTDMSFSSSQDLARQEESGTGGLSQESPLAEDDDDSISGRESEAVNLQIIMEASQQSEMEAAAPPELLDEYMPADRGDAKMTEGAEQDEEQVTVGPVGATVRSSQADEEAAVEKSVAGRIMGALREGLEGLRTATLTREEANKIEDMFFDIKKELYQAESRSRG